MTVQISDIPAELLADHTNSNNILLEQHPNKINLPIRHAIMNEANPELQTTLQRPLRELLQVNFPIQELFLVLFSRCESQEIQSRQSCLFPIGHKDD